MKCTLVFLLFLFGCSTLVKPEVVDTSTIRVSSDQCGLTKIIREGLRRYGERIVSSATMRVTPADTVIVTLFRSPNGDWTIMLDSRNGISCMVLWGKHWQGVGQES
jgi:hypothetical protein